ncbi:hypothetical protein [Chondrinema litorale]|uniref:hypothetical protein n=1 Tax=Chondrinema litorale TaxID=2994555 RepID=UPI002542AF26|nr:hypothetical protein [Chondrinema litorale]UZS00214.1 hypothetical protein OQ292_40550 [Chondrinema litorale]
MASRETSTANRNASALSGTLLFQYGKEIAGEYLYISKITLITKTLAMPVQFRIIAILNEALRSIFQILLLIRINSIFRTI